MEQFDRWEVLGEGLAEEHLEMLVRLGEAIADPLAMGSCAVSTASAHVSGTDEMLLTRNATVSNTDGHDDDIADGD